MKLELNRDVFTEKSTTGPLLVDTMHSCFILEDKDRQLEKYPEAKVYGRSAIPRGTYKIRLSYSPRFQRVLPELIDVPGFTRVRIHPGNTAGDTEGCLLPGRARNVDWVGPSMEVFTRLFDLMETAVARGEEIEITIT